MATAHRISKQQLINVFFFISLLIWMLAIFSPLFEFITSEFAIFSVLFLKTFSAVCHQDHDKSIILGKQIFVCARCAGIYTGTFLSCTSLIFRTGIRIKNIKFLFLTAILILMDVLLVNAGVYNYSHFVAFITGLFFGFIIYQQFFSLVEDFVIERFVND